MFVSYERSFGIFVFYILINAKIFCQTDSSTMATTENVSPCPNPSELLPYCVCSSISAVSNLIDCSPVQNEDQLESVFTKDIFSRDLEYEFLIRSNFELKYLSKNVFGNLSFTHITFDRVTEIEYIDESSFINSYSTLASLRLKYCKLLAQGFPFDSLRFYTSLVNVYFDTAGRFDVLPKISSESIRRMIMRNCSISYLHNLAFSDIPNLGELSLLDNNINSIPKGIFDQNLQLQIVRLFDNFIEVIYEGTFKNLPNLTIIDLRWNQISHIEPAAFYNLPMLRTLDLRSNFLPYLLFEHLGFLPSLINIYLTTNNITYIDGDSFLGCPELTCVDANNLEITTIAAGTFDGKKVMEEFKLLTWDESELLVLFNGSLFLDNNFLTTLDENWLRTVLVKLNIVFIIGNPLECGCELTWLFEDTTLMDGLLYAQCKNGTYLHEMDQNSFLSNCQSN